MREADPVTCRRDNRESSIYFIYFTRRFVYPTISVIVELTRRGFNSLSLRVPSFLVCIFVARSSVASITREIDDGGLP